MRNNRKIFHARNFYAIILIALFPLHTFCQTDTITFYSESSEIQNGETICLPVYVDGFKSVESMQISLNWHPGKLDFIEVQSINPNTNMSIDDFGFSDADKGIMRVIYVDVLSGGTSLPDSSVLFEVCFHVNGQPNAPAPFNISNYDRILEVYGNGDFMHVEALNSAQTITEPANTKIFSRTCADQVLSGNQGRIRFTVYGGIGPFVYAVSKLGDPNFLEGGQINPGQVAQFTQLSQGTYEILVADVLGNETTKFVTVTEAKGFSVPLEVLDPFCPKDSTGQIEILDIVGGVSPHVISWSPGEVVRPGIENLPVGSYTLSIEDANRCLFTKDVTLATESPELLIQPSPPECRQSNDGSLFIEVVGANRFADSTVFLGLDSTQMVRDSNFLLENLMGGEHAIYLRDSNFCIHEYSYFLKAINKYSIEVLNNSPTQCLHSNDGVIEFQKYLNDTTHAEIEYILNPNFGIETRNDSIVRIENLAAGEYSLTLFSDRSVCVNDTSFTILRADTLDVQALLIGDETCSGDSTGFAYIRGIGGDSTQYSYNWSNGYSGDSLENVSHGLYTVTVTDANDCIAEADVFISEGTRIVIEEEIINPPTCPDGNDGTARLIAGSVEGVESDTLIYDWQGFPSIISGDTSQLQGLMAQSYPFTIRDEKNCMRDFTLDVPTPDSITAHIILADSILCDSSDRGSILLQLSGGTEPYETMWSDSISGLDRNDLSPGVHRLSARDANDCESVFTFEITLTERPAYSFNTEQNKCLGDTTASFELTIDDQSVDTVYFIPEIVPEVDSNVYQFQNLEDGVYHFIIRDINGCDHSDSVVLETDAVNYTIDKANETCQGTKDGYIGLNFDDTSKLLEVQIIPNINSTEDTLGYDLYLDSLSARTYYLAIVDSNLCLYRDTTRIKSLAGDYSFNGEEPICHGDSNGALQVIVSSLTAFDTIGIQPAADSVLIEEDSSVSFLGLKSQNYSILLQDSSGCAVLETYFLSEPDSMTIELDIIHHTDQHLGAVKANVSGGIAPYTYLWDIEGAGDTDTISDVHAGNYSLTVTDSRGCMQTIEFDIIIVNTNEFIQSEYKVFPNPFTEEFVIEAIDRNEEYSMEIRDISGKLVMQRKELRGTQTISASHMQAGIYIMKLKTGDGVFVFKMLCNI